MRTLFILFISLFVTPAPEVLAKSFNGTDSLEVLHREVIQLFKNYQVTLPDEPEQDITVNFLLNAKNEIIILDVHGDSANACDYVREVLNYRKVKFDQARQLIQYTITIHLIRDYE